jgi:hypothetical protein
MDIIDVLIASNLVTIAGYAFTSLKLMDTRTELKSLVELENTLIGNFTSLRTRVEALEMADEPVNISNEPEYVREDDAVSANLSIQERILMREAEFDRRINEMKGATGIIPPGTVIPYAKNEFNPARVLHPDVHNIPHEAVDLRDAQLPDVEIPKEDS